MSNGICTDDPDELLNEWLGELENLIGVSLKLIFIVRLSLTNLRSSMSLYRIRGFADFFKMFVLIL